MEGSDPRGTGARFGRGAARVLTRSSPPPSGVAPLELSLREGTVSAASRRRWTRWPTGWADELFGIAGKGRDGTRHGSLWPSRKDCWLGQPPGRVS